MIIDIYFDVRTNEYIFKFISETTKKNYFLEAKRLGRDKGEVNDDCLPELIKFLQDYLEEKNHDNIQAI
jgi:hypothetical protein